MMRKTLFLISLLYIIAAIPALAKSPDFIVTGDYRGEIKPCGCSALGGLGGIERTSTFLKQQSHPLWVDLGNFSGKPTEQGKLKTNLFADYFRRLNIQAVLPGPKEFARGKGHFREVRLPYVLTNQRKIYRGVYRQRYIYGYRVYGFLSPELLSHGTHKTDVVGSVKSFIPRVARGNSKKILLFRGSDAELAAILKQRKFDFVFKANLAKSEETQDLKSPLSNVYIPPVRGQGLLVVNSKTKKSQVTWISEKLSSDQSWKQDFERYDQKVEELFEAYIARQMEQPDKRVYKGVSHCVSCHNKEHKVYQTTRHAKAWQSLKKVGKDFDPECIQCHTVGFQQGGFVSEEFTPDLINVQCENCHGITPDHADDATFKTTRKKVTEQTCKGCHFGSHSPTFDFNVYFPKVRHSKE